MNRDFLDILRELSAAQADYLVIGAFAVGVHAEPRATGDPDVFVRPSAGNADRVYAALQKFCAPLSDLTVADLANAGTVFQMGVPPYRIDIINEISGVTFDQAWHGRIMVDIDGFAVSFIGREELLRNKIASGRNKDILDVELLRKHGK